jgi:hypothetical protein
MGQNVGACLSHKVSGGEIDVGAEVGAAGGPVATRGDDDRAVEGGVGGEGGSLLVGRNGVQAPSAGQDVVLQSHLRIFPAENST